MRFQQVIESKAPAEVFIVRLLVGGVFLSEGIQKFLFASELGAGRFVKLGIPYPDFFGPFVGSFEVCCGLLIILGILTRLAAIPLLVIMLVAIYTTKIPTLINEGFWKTIHDGRADMSMLFCSLFLLLVGGGKCSLDARLSSKNEDKNSY